MNRKATSRDEGELTHVLLDHYGRTYAAEAGIRLHDTPQPLYQLLVLSLLLSARIRGEIAVAAARELFQAGMRSPKGMAQASWQQRVDALGRGGYRRYDERTATMLGEGAELLLERHGGDLRRLRGAEDLAKRLQEFPGIGPTGADIFLREVQGIWPECAPHLDRKVRDGADRIGLPTSAEALARLVAEQDLPRLAAGLVRVALDKDAAREVQAAVSG